MTQPRKVPYLPPLDGLRAVAVIAVLLYHADLSWLSGGYLGVEVFFVISGYLITSLLLREWRETGRVDLRGFWLRRARRLLPELLVVILVCLAVAVVFLPDEAARLRDDALAATFYVMNWRLIFSHQSYFESLGRPSLFQHLWSLAVEEQFYLLWPPIFAISIGRLRPRGVLALALAGAGGAALLMATLYQRDGDVSRIYYGTDTRASGVLIGAALALLWNPWAERKPAAAGMRAAIGLGGVAAMATLLFWFHSLDQSSAFLYQAGFAAVGLVTALGIVAIVHPASRELAAIFGSRPLRWAGTRSYGIYLWHWPLFMITRPHQDVDFGGLPLLALRLGTTFVLAELSYRFVLTPVRAGAIGRSVRAMRGPATVQAWSLRATSFGGVVLLVLLLGSLAVVSHPAPPSYLQVNAFHGVIAARVAPDDSGAPAATATATDEPTMPREEAVATDTATPDTTDDSNAAGEATATPVPAPLPNLPPAHLNANVFAVGDSVMIGAASELGRAGTVEIDAEVGRQASTVVSVLQNRKKAGPLPPAVVIHTGNNGVFTRGQLDQMMTTLSGVGQVVFVNDKVDRKWEEGNNAMMAAAAGDYRNVTLVDWHGAASGHSELFANDGLHLTYDGADLYAKMIAAAIHPAPPPAPTPAATATPPPVETETPLATASATPSETATPAATVTPTAPPSSPPPTRTVTPSPTPEPAAVIPIGSGP